MKLPIDILAACCVLTLLCGCHNPAKVAPVASDSAVAGVLPVYGAAKDTTKKMPVAAKETGSEEGGEDELKGFYAEEIASYTKPCIIDSTFKLGTDRYRLLVKDSCLMDSAITVPRKYVSMYELDSFVTHNFICKLRLEKEGKVMLERVITKKDFDLLLDESLHRYAAIRCPSVYLKGDSILLGYSISIPLTDVGRQFYAVIGGGGNIIFREAMAGD